MPIAIYLDSHFRIQIPERNQTFDVTELEEESILFEADRSSSRLYRMRGDGSLIVVKSIFFSDSISKSQIQSEIANLVSAPSIDCKSPWICRMNRTAAIENCAASQKEILEQSDTIPTVISQIIEIITELASHDISRLCE